MATIKEILEIEQCSDASIHLHKEGAFWKAYQKSAFQVHRMEPSFKVKKEFVKVAGCHVASLGFPESTLKRLFREEEIEKVNEKLLRIACDVLDGSAYQAWFDSIAAATPPRSAAASQPQAHSDNETAALKRLREFPMEGVSPIECMTFLASLRKELAAHGNL